jgi:AraC-like DNA-binding protein
MNKNNLSFSEIDSDLSFSQLAESLHSKFINGTIRVIPARGAGMVKKVKLEEGLYLRAWDLRLHDPFVFNKIPAEIVPEEKTFHIAYVLNPESFLFKRKDFTKALKFPQGINILFFSDDAVLDFEIPAGYHFQAVDLSVTYSWLANAFRDEERTFGSCISQLNAKPHPTSFFESCTAAEYRVLADLHSTCLSESKGSLHVKADVLSLLSDFFIRIFTRSPYKTLQNRVLDYEKMLAVEKILEEHVDSTLPPIEIIASRMAMSESTLKRHFKQMFGKNIYRYYLEMKMDFAKKMLLEKPMRVNEVAALLDYDKVSNFIMMFKRRHGFSPGSLLKANVPLNTFSG